MRSRVLAPWFLEHHQMRRSLLVLSFGALLGTGFGGCSKPQSAAQPRPAPAVKQDVGQQPAIDAAAQAPGPLDTLRRELAEATDSDTRVRFIDQIAAQGPNARPALDDLVEASASSDARVRWHAARAIGLIGEDALSVLPKLISLLSDEDPIVVAQSAAAIGLIRKDDERSDTPTKDVSLYASAFDPLAKTTLHPDARARRAAVRALQVLKPAPEVLLPLFSRQMADADPSVVLPALHTLADMKEEAMPVLLEALKDPKSRYWASVALAEIGPAAAAAVEPLAKLASEGEVDEKLQAILALAAIGTPAQAAAPQLVKALESNEEMLQFAAAFAIGKLHVPEAEAALERTAGSENKFLASIAAWARAQLHPDDKSLVADAVDRLKNGLGSDKPRVRCSSVSGLSDLSEFLDDGGKQELADEFSALIADADPDVALAAGAALVRLGQPAVAPLEAKLSDAASRLPAMEILGTIGTPAKQALPAMMAALADPDETYRSDAAVAIANFGSDAAPAVPNLVKLLQAGSNGPGTMYAAAYALGRIGPAAKPALEKLRELTASEDELMATVAVWSALKIEPTDSSLFASAVPRLRKALRSEKELVRLEAAVALGDIGLAASPALPLLELVAEDDPLPAVRQAAEQAIAKISAGAAQPVAP
jgi:HEAT repeat protein